MLGIDRFRAADGIGVPVGISGLVAAQDQIRVSAGVQGEKDAGKAALRAELATPSSLNTWFH